VPTRLQAMILALVPHYFMLSYMDVCIRHLRREARSVGHERQRTEPLEWAAAACVLQRSWAEPQPAGQCTSADM
jgi:hypothetical protein